MSRIARKFRPVQVEPSARPDAPQRQKSSLRVLQQARSLSSLSTALSATSSLNIPHLTRVLTINAEDCLLGAAEETYIAQRLGKVRVTHIPAAYICTLVRVEA